MGYVKDWSNMLEGFFKEMFFEVDWMFLPEEDLPVESVIYSDEKKRELFEDGTLWIRQREALWEKNEEWQAWEEREDPNEWKRIEEKRAWEKRQLEELIGLSAAGEIAKSFGSGENFAFDGGENFAWTSFGEEIGYKTAFNRSESGWAYEIEKFTADGYAAENFEKMLAGEAFYPEATAEDIAEKMIYYRGGGGYGLMIGEEVHVMEREYDRCADEREKIKLKRDKREKLLSTFEEAANGQSHEIKIEMVRHESEKNEIDMDETLDMLTERLCNLMAKGADGFYL